MNNKLYKSLRNLIKNEYKQRNILFYIRLILSCLAWYTAIYWVADSRYNRELARLEARVTNLVTRLEGNNWRKAIEDIPVLQRTLVPNEPLFFDIFSVYKSLNPNYDGHDEQVVKELSKMLFAHKEELYKLNLSTTIINASNTEYDRLFSLILDKCNFTNSDFTKSNLRNIKYMDAALEFACFLNSDMAFSQYMHSNLNHANFSNAQMNDSFFDLVTLDGTNFQSANLENSYIIGVDFSKVLNLSTANLQSVIYNSREIIDTINYHSSLKSKELEYCQHKKLEQCFLTKYAITPKSNTKFPANFHPEAHGMIDLSDFIDFIKSHNN